MSIIRQHAAFATMLGLVLFLAGARPVIADENAVLSAQLDAQVGAFMATDQVPGAIATVVSGETVISRGYGTVDIDAATATGADNSRFEIGSITKLFTWVTVMMLVEEGRLDLDTDVARYLGRGVGIPGDDPLSLAQLMSHRGGFEESYAIFDPEITALPRAEALTVAAPDQVFARGVVTSYSNWGAALAGHIIEQVSGEPWEDVVQARILDPLGMNNTTLAEHRRRAGQPPLAHSYRVQSGIAHPAYRVDIGAFGPAGATASTAVDMARFLQFLIGDGAVENTRLLRPETMAKMRTRLFDDRPGAADMAHGFQDRPLFGTTVYGHGGGLNEFTSNLVFIPEIEAGVFISQNGGTSARLPLLAPRLILGTLAQQAGLEVPAARPVPDAAVRAADAAGRYLTNRRTFAGPGQLLAALSPLRVTALPDGALLVPSPLSQGLVRHDPVAPDIWQDAQGARIAILRDESGKVVRLADGTGAHTHERLRGLADPNWLWLAYGLAVVMALMTLAGALWRRGLGGGGRAGKTAALVSFVAAAAVLMLAVAAIAAALAATRLGAQFLFDQPQPTLTAFLTMGNVVAIIAAVNLVCLIFVWRARDWSLWRRIHHSAFSLALVALAGLMLRWGLAFGGPI